MQKPREDFTGANDEEFSNQQQVGLGDFHIDESVMYDSTEQKIIARQKEQLSKAIIPGEAETIIGKFTATRAGFFIPDEATEDEVMYSLQLLSRMEKRIQLWIGDALNHTSLDYGELKDIAEKIGYDPDTLSNWKSTTKRVKSSLRRELLDKYLDAKAPTMSHYELIASMENEVDQRYWLEEKLKNNWSVADMRKAIKADSPTDEKLTNHKAIKTAKNLSKYLTLSEYNNMRKSERRILYEEVKPLLPVLKAIFSEFEQD